MRAKEVTENGTVAKTYDVNDERFSKLKALGFACTRASSIVSSLMIAEITYFATTSLALTAAAVSAGMAVKTACDALTDLFMGSLIDKTKSKYGKARPYTLAGIFVWLCIIAIFFIPTGLFDGMSDGRRNFWMVAYIIVFAILASAVFETMRGCCLDTLLKRCVVKDDNRVKTLSVMGVVLSVCSLALQALMPMVIAAFNYTQKGFQILAIVFGIMGIVMSVVAFMLCKEYSQEELNQFAGLDGNEEKNEVSIREFLKNIGKNKYVIPLTLINFVIMFFVNGSYLTGQYYFQYVFGDLSAYTIVMISSVVAFPLMFVFPALKRKFSTKQIFLCTLVISGVGIIIRVIAPNILAVQCVGYILFSLANLALVFLGSQMTINCMEYGFYKTGLNVEAMYSSFVSFAQKVSGSVSSLIIGFLLSNMGFDALTSAVAKNGFESWGDIAALGTQGYEQYVEGGAATVSQAMLGINISYNLVPLISIIIVILLLIRFNLEKDLDVLRKEHGIKISK